jgi:hypothetical protein
MLYLTFADEVTHFERSQSALEPHVINSFFKKKLHVFYRSRDSAVGVATGYGLESR